ncbi:hypothetical protein Tco_0817124 [Tanacetum coccineum]
MQTQVGMVNEGIALDAGLDSEASTYDNTLTEHQDGSSSSRHSANAERTRVDKVVSDKQNANVGPSYDNNTLTEVHQLNNNTFENVIALEIQTHGQHEVENCTNFNREAHYVMKTDVPKAEHSRNSSSFSDSKCFICSTCQKCVFNANHDACITNLLKVVNSSTKVQSHKTTKRYISIEKKSNAKKLERRITIGQKFYPNKSSAVYVKTTPPRSGLTWKPTGRIFTSCWS